MFEENVILNSLMENCLDIISIKDLNFNYKVCNRSFLKFFHFFHETNVLGKNIQEVLSPESYEIVEKNLQSVLQTREPQTYTFKITDSSGEKIISELSTPVVEDGEITGILSVAKDITNEENLKLKLVDKIFELNLTLDKKNKLEAQKELFLTTLTHDLKNPVQAQLMSLKMLKSGTLGNLNSAQEEILDILLESSDYMEKMLYSILRTYKYDNGLIELDKKNCDIGKLTQTCMKEVEALAGDRGIKINYEYKPIEITIDSEQIRRVISNLINNAINYAYKNSEIKINIKNDENIRFSISNFGFPIPESVQNHIFEKYSTGNNLKGIGLGLYFSKKVIEAHGGIIELRTKGELSEFSFCIPMTYESQKTLINW